MASSKARTPTYHVTPHFNIAAAGGALTLGTVVKDLLELAPLNRGPNHEPVPENEIYPPTLQTGFHATREQLRSGKFGVWAQALWMSGIGSHINISGEQNDEEMFSCDSIETTYFDPTDEWVAKCLDAKPVKDYMEGSWHRREVYIITGLKVAKNFTYGSAASPKANAEVGLRVNVPQAPVAGEIKGDINNEKIQTLGFQSTDIVVGCRVNKCQYKRKHRFFGELKLDDRLYTRGAQTLSLKMELVKEPDLPKIELIMKSPLDQQEGEEQTGPTQECRSRDKALA
ncbi:hypothetical protein F4776DRAFT_85869 [Hypoxylon sp. NC0597]|nr:hypothetical protein F4776DRAFT_85869 [Hypoxylon sp. NC0597]